MLTALETQVSYIPFSSINREENRYQFRQKSPERIDSLRQSLTKSGQLHPILLEQTPQGSFLVLDGHLRCEAIFQIRTSGGSWDKMMARIVNENDINPLNRFKWINERNNNGEFPYNLQERGAFFADFLTQGLSIKQIASEMDASCHEIEDTIDLSTAPLNLLALLNQNKIDLLLASMLRYRFEGWKIFSDEQTAVQTAKQLLEHAKKEKQTVKSWRFLLDFYWSRGRPFLKGRSKK